MFNFTSMPYLNLSFGPMMPLFSTSPFGFNLNGAYTSGMSIFSASPFGFNLNFQSSPMMAMPPIFSMQPLGFNSGGGISAPISIPQFTLPQFTNLNNPISQNPFNPSMNLNNNIGLNGNPNDALKILQHAMSFKDFSSARMGQIMRRDNYPYHSAWCADFVHYILGTCGANIPAWYNNIHNKAWVGNVLKAARNANAIVATRQGNSIDLSQARPGDLIIFDWEGDSLRTGNADKTDHIGIVKEVRGNTLIAIEGNNGSKVSQRTYTPQGRGCFANTRSIHTIIRVC